MDVVRTQADMRARSRLLAKEGRSVALVPTMGALHEGHLSLIRSARAECDAVVMSLFVNPLQFAVGEDLAAYPRNERRDLELAEAEGVEVVFAPTSTGMYGDSPATTVGVGRLATVVEGASRPHHFDGVCTVVAKLFNIVRPTIAFFGQKDAQQVAVVRKMAADLSFGIEIAVCPTIREPDGLATSSRNGFLSADERKRATVLWRALETGREAILAGHGIGEAERRMSDVIAREDGVVPDYARAVDPDDFESPRTGGQVLLVVAARVGETRLIDNLLVGDVSKGD